MARAKFEYPKGEKATMIRHGKQKAAECLFESAELLRSVKVTVLEAWVRARARAFLGSENGCRTQSQKRNGGLTESYRRSACLFKGVDFCRSGYGSVLKLLVAECQK